MKKIKFHTTSKKLLADIHTPVGIYLRLRDRFRDTILLESTDHHAADNSFSYIGINAIAGIEIINEKMIEYKYPLRDAERKKITGVPADINSFIENFDPVMPADKMAKIAQGLFGYTTYNAVQFFDTVKIDNGRCKDDIPLMRYRFYQYLIAIDHFRDELYLCENIFENLVSEISVIESLIRSRDLPSFPFAATGDESSNLTDAEYMQMVGEGIAHCLRGNTFQVVLSRRFSQTFRGDEFNVYRALRSINPSPYLFYFDYGDYRLLGSSPEAQLIVRDGKAIMHPIAGTVKRTGDEAEDEKLAAQLLNDPKENAEHVMLVDLARNDLSRICDEVGVSYYKQVHHYSHVIHLVSEVKGKIKKDAGVFSLLATSFPAGTLSGAPKFKAMEIIESLEPTSRNYYGGCIGFIGFDGSCNHAIMIRTFLSKQNTLHYQAGAGVVAASVPANELAEVNNKLNALKQAIKIAASL